MYAVDEVGAVERYVQMSRESERLGVEGYEGEVDAGLPADVEGVGQVVFVERGPHLRQGADELVGEEGDVVAVDVDVGHGDADGLLHALLRQHFVDACLTACADGLLFGVGRAAVVVGGQQFAVGHGEHGLPADGRGVDVVGQEVEFAVDPFLAFQAVEVVDEEGGLLVAVALPVVLFVGRVVVAVVYHPADELDGRVVLLAVVFAAGLHDDFLQGVGGGRQCDVQLGLRGGAYGAGVFVVSHGRHCELGLRTAGGEAEVAFVVGHASFGGSFQVDGCVGQRFLCQGIGYCPAQGVLCLQGEGGTYEHDPKNCFCKLHPTMF